MLFETCLVVDGEVQNRADHNERVARSSLALWGHKIELPWDTLESDLRVDDEIQPGQVRLRVEYDKTGVIRVDNRPYFKSVMALVRVFETFLTYEHKFADRGDLEAIYKHRGLAHDVLMVIDGLVTDTTTANVAMFDGKSWFTPRKPLLLGTCRARMLRQGLLKETDITEEQIRGAQSVVVMNALRGVQPVALV
jgi:4-amino-4-deoxychorismate lyase